MKQVAGVWLPDADQHFTRIAKGGTYNSGHYYAARVYVKDFGLALDVGAHVGYWSRLMAEDFKVVFAFGPEIENFNCLLKNAPSNVKMVPYAISDWVGGGRLNNPKPTNTGAWELEKVEERLKGVWPTTVWPLDRITTYLENYGPVGLIKIDVQGGELNVLRGARKLLEKHKPVVVVEDTDKGITALLSDLGASKVDKKAKDAIFAWKDNVSA